MKSLDADAVRRIHSPVFFVLSGTTALAPGGLLNATNDNDRDILPCSHGSTDTTARAPGNGSTRGRRNDTGGSRPKQGLVAIVE